MVISTRGVRKITAQRMPATAAPAADRTDSHIRSKSRGDCVS